MKNLPGPRPTTPATHPTTNRKSPGEPGQHPLVCPKGGRATSLESPYSDDHYDPLVITEPSPASRADWVKAATNSKRVLGIFIAQEFPFALVTAKSFSRRRPSHPSETSQNRQRRRPIGTTVKRNHAIDVPWSYNNWTTVNDKRCTILKQ